MYKVKTNEIVDKGYERCLDMFDVLRGLSVEERMALYDNYQWMFSCREKITLENLVLKPRPSSMERFRLWFYLIGNKVLTGPLLGCWNYEEFLKAYPKKGMNSYEFPHKVLLALGMMGYIAGLREDYSNSKKCPVLGKIAGHGRIYQMNLLKVMGWQSTMDEFMAGELYDFQGWSPKRDLVIEFDIEDTTWVAYPMWQSAHQMKSISSLSLQDEADEYARSILAKYDGYCIYGLPKGERKDAINAYNLSIAYNNLKDGIIGSCTVDDYGGRFYTMPTGMKSKFRLKYLRLAGEMVAEVDVGSAQPFFLGARILKQKGVRTHWLEHCLAGDFYEWVKGLTGMDGNKATIKKMVMAYIYSYNKPHDKRWFKYGVGLFCTRLDSYLKKNDKEIYAYIQHYKNHPVKGKKGKMRSDLSRELVMEEVAYIQKCLASVPKRILCYNIHDCISCKKSDAATVKEVMLQVGREMYGLEMRINIETL